ncbi:type IX secretion system outer membrane channel protein PorV [Sandaracinomonas limnophila]|jgi:hypothetical protein|uniref:Type IX secretion system outer membrane channel protein PorV n=2 Tax=Sandaracinomonas limnophila TaxID=1862386 RepID=A0A437PU54_9BACT|nr:type IX secretion system outer membrane channel protein PorV [Sandaracinomonas limnophila]
MITNKSIKLSQNIFNMINKSKVIGSLLTVFFTSVSSFVFAQTTQNLIPSPTMLFLNVAPDARAAGMGDAGVAVSTDVNSIFWNPGKLATSENNLGFAVSYSPWLKNIVQDMALYNVSGYQKKGNDQAFGFSIIYFDQGTFQATSSTGTSLGNFNSKEYAITGTYSKVLTKILSLGVNLKYINSNLLGSFQSSNTVMTPAQTVAADIGLFWNKNSGKSWNTKYGLTLSNISGKVSYGGSDKNFIPTNLRLGMASTKDLGEGNKFTVALDFNKLMVPTPKDAAGSNLKDVTAIGGIFSSLFDSPNGFGDELKEVTTSLGIEYLLKNTFALRTGYFNESAEKGNRKYATFGVGFKLDQKYNFDFSYLVPTGSNSPLSNTLRVSLIAAINSGGNTTK